MQNDLFSPVLITVLTSNILIALVSLFLRHTKLMHKAGYAVLSFAVCLILLRLLFPVELPFSHNLLLPETLSCVIVNLRCRSILLYNTNIMISPWDIFKWIWLIGTIIGFARYIHSYRTVRTQIVLYGNFLTGQEPYYSALEQICRQEKRKNRFQIVEWAGVNTPSLFGILRPCILIPPSCHLTSGYLHIVLRHEAAHHFHHDLLLKTCVKIITLLYWWNPFCRILNRQADLLLDLRIDHKLSSENFEARHEYLGCLLHIADLSLSENTSLKDQTVSISRNSALITARFASLAYGPQKFIPIMAILLAACSGIFIFSYLYIFEAEYYSPEVLETTDSPSDIGYAIYTNEGEYEIYYYGVYIETVDSLNYYTDDFKVYNEKGELLNEN